MSSKIVNCKVCGKEIAKSAKVCPHCGARRKKHTVLGIVLAILGIFLIIGALSEGSDSPKKAEVSTRQPQENASNQESSQLKEPASFGVGDQVELNGISVTFDSVSENSGGNYMTPSDGKVFVVCEFTIENNSEKDIAVSSLLSFDAYIDDYTSGLNLSAMLSTDKSQLDGTIAAGKKMTGVIGYEADPDWKNIEIRFTPDFWSGKKFIFTYNK